MGHQNLRKQLDASSKDAPLAELFYQNLANELAGTQKQFH